MSTTEVASEAITEYPIPLPHGTRVRLRMNTAHSPVGTSGTVSAQKGSYGAGSGKDNGLHVLFDGKDETEYILSPPYNQKGVEGYFDVLSLPGAEKIGLTDKDGNDLHVGDRVVYDAGPGEWQGTTGTVVGKGPTGNLAAITVDPVKQDGTPHFEYAEYKSAENPANLQAQNMTKLGHPTTNDGLPFLSLVRWINVPGALGLVVGWSEGHVKVFRVGTPDDYGHLGLGVQETGNGSLEVVPLYDRPTIEANNGSVTLGARVKVKDGKGTPAMPSGETGTIVGRSGDGYAAILFDREVDRYDLTPLGGINKSTVISPGVTLTDMFEFLPPIFAEQVDDEPSGESTGTTDRDGRTVYIGDRVMFVSPHVGAYVGHVGEVIGTSAGGFRVQREDEVKEWGASYVVKVGEPVSTEGQYQYEDGITIKYGDRVVINPGHNSAGTIGTVIGTVSSYVVIHHDHDGGTSNWSPGNFSRLQDEDKEKLVDEAPVLAPASERFQEVLDQIGDLKDEVEQAVSRIESELDDVENGYIQVEIEAETVSDNMSYDVTVQTSNSELLGMISYDGGGSLEIDDAAVDDYAQSNASVEFQGSFETEVHIGDRLGDLHSAFNKGQQKVEALLEAVADAREVLTQVLSDPEVTVKAETTVIPSKVPETFEGIIHNARIGVVLPEDADGPALRFDVVGNHIESYGGDSSGTKATRRVRLTGAQIGRFLTLVAVSDVKHLEGRKAVLTEDAFGGFYPTLVSEVPEDLDFSDE